MKQRKMLSFTLYQLGLFFRQELPGLVAQADASRDAGELDVYKRQVLGGMRYVILLHPRGQIHGSSRNLLQ